MDTQSDQPSSTEPISSGVQANQPIQTSDPNLIVPFAVHDLALSYIFCFDFGSEENISYTKQNEIEIIKSFTEGIYFINKDEVDFSGDSPSNIINDYRVEMYKRRFKNSVLSQRNSIIIQFPEYGITGISHENKEIISKDQIVTLSISATLNEMGIGTLVFWLNLNGNFSFTELSKLRDVFSLFTTVDIRSGFDNKLRLHGTFSFIELAQFFIICLSTTKKAIFEIDQIQDRLSRSVKLSDIYASECDKNSTDFKISHDIDIYPIYHFDFTSDIRMKSSVLKIFTSQHKEKIRGLITGDLNWDKKKKKVIESFYDNYTFSSRDSIEWFSHPNGSLKIYSNDLETPILTSKLLITFELEIILTMKYFLYKLIHNLNYFSEIAKSSYPIRSLSKLRDKEMRKLDDYYSLDFLQKDTTISRISRFKEMMNIDMILEIAEKKIESLNTYTTTEYQNAIGWQQLILTIIFGIFGAGNLTFLLLDYGIKKQIFALGFKGVFISTIASMILSAIIILLVFHRNKMN